MLIVAPFPENSTGDDGLNKASLSPSFGLSVVRLLTEVVFKYGNLVRPEGHSHN